MVRRYESQNENLVKQVEQVSQGNVQSMVSFTQEDEHLRKELTSARTTIAALKLEADTWADAAGQTQNVVHELLLELEAEKQQSELALCQSTLADHRERIAPSVAIPSEEERTGKTNEHTNAPGVSSGERIAPSLNTASEVIVLDSRHVGIMLEPMNREEDHLYGVVRVSTERKSSLAMRDER